MKRLNLIPVFFAVTMALSLSSKGQSTESLKSGHYIVVAAYKANQENFAKRYTEKLTQGGSQANYGFDASRNLYYVFLASYSDFSESVQAMLKTRGEGNFADAWVRVLKGEIASEPVALKEEPKKEIKNEVVEVKEEPKKTEVKEEAKEVKSVLVKTEEAPVKKEEPQKEEVKITQPSPEEVEEIIENPKAKAVYFPQTLKNTPVFLSLYNPRNGKMVSGKVDVIDTDLNRLLTTVDGNSYVTLPDPQNKSGRLTLISAPFGYRKIQNIINYRSTEADTLLPYIDMIGNYYMVKFDMVRYHAGDIVTLYNVYFYNDAAIMLPESTYELNSLLQMMEDNPEYKIRLHGHTNGNHRGKITYMGPSRDFFSITPDVKEAIGTAKELSGARAELIKQWLISKGIAADRMDVKAWGGSRMIHDKNSQHARRNVRVEVEVLQD